MRTARTLPIKLLGLKPARLATVALQSLGVARNEFANKGQVLYAFVFQGACQLPFQQFVQPQQAGSFAHFSAQQIKGSRFALSGFYSIYQHHE